jgi:hypothetical protein
MRKLQELKAELGAKSYREVIIVLMEKSKRLPKTMKGSFPKLKPMTRKEELEIVGAGHE